LIYGEQRQECRASDYLTENAKFVNFCNFSVIFNKF
jgi:hypothetical protein